ncbi:unnamed protein product [Microthlaspi erraticum]|uniref:F-box associated beta-propeller type 1 domain-containing protein n=1 Tax=Microthlaspi erraticum TaxID=1685480 RepID=A0A6D2K213_9BRAS|nr:unnamed protein product [Microthlaspi erraticum]
MMITNLPMDLMEDILSRVPLKSKSSAVNLHKVEYFIEKPDLYKDALGGSNSEILTSYAARGTASVLYASGTSSIWGRFSYGIGYEDKRCGRNYKILRFIDLSLYEEGNKFFWYEVYDFETGLWTTLDVTDPYWRITSGCGFSQRKQLLVCYRKGRTRIMIGANKPTT